MSTSLPTTGLRPLWADSVLIVATVAGSTAERAGEVACYLARALDVAGKRAERAAALREQRSARIREGIRLAIGPTAQVWASAQQLQNRINAGVGPARFGLDSTPDLATLRSELRDALKNT